MANQHTMAELLRASTEGYAEAIVVPLILAEQFELKHSLVNMMTSDQFFGLEKDNPHDHIRWFNKITSTIKYKDVPNSTIKLMLFPFSLEGAARRWLEKEPPHSILTWEDLVSKFINKFFPPSIITNLRNEISNFQQRFDESFHKAWVRYKDLIPILKQFQATPPPDFVKVVEEICVTCGGAHPYYQCLAAGGNTFPELRDNIQGYVAAAAVNYNQGNFVYRPPVFFQMNTASTFGSGSLPSNTIANPKGELKAITTRSGIVLDGPSVPIPPPFINPKEDERVEETLTDQDLAEEPRKFLIPCGFNELMCKALTDLGASINLMPLSIWKKLGLLKLISTRMTLELANRAICTPTGIARDVFILVGKFTFPVDFVIVEYESDPRVPLILGRPFLRTARALIDIHGEEMSLRDGDERLTLNMRHDTSSYLNQPQKESINLINVFNDSSEGFLKNLFSTNQPSGNPTFSSHLELTSPEVKDNIFDPEGGNVLPEKLLDLDSIKDLYPLYHDIDSILKDSFNQSNLFDLNDNLVDSMPEMFTDEQALDYSPPPLFEEYDDDLFKVESGTEYVYDDPFDSKGEKIKEFKLLIDELDLPCDFLLPSMYDSFLSKDFSKVDALPTTNNEDKVFNP
nr:reverse transcriptase domain-containing protein [Tanacetum cinerariifolium]